MFTGRVVQPGEPEFLSEDTDGAIALEMEEADTCPQCGYPKDWCRDAKNHQFSFEGFMSTCWASEAIEVYKKIDRYKNLKDTVRAATQLGARFREGKDPDLFAGLGLEDV